MAKFLVTGGCGFIGSHLCHDLAARGHHVRVLDDLSSGRTDNLPAGVELVIGDVVDDMAVAQAMADVDGCFHLAAIASVQRSNEEWIVSHRTNLTGAITVFDVARRSARAIPVVYASSAAVYGDTRHLPLAESTPPRPLTAYGADKLGCELHGRVASLVHGVATTGLRFFNVFGPRQDPRSPYSGVISLFAGRLAKGQPLTIFGDGRQTRDFVYVGDVVAHLWAAMVTMKAEPRVLNVCTGQATTILELAEVLGELAGRPERIEFRPPRPGDIRASLGDPRLAIAHLGVAARITLREGLRQTWAGLSAEEPGSAGV